MNIFYNKIIFRAKGYNKLIFRAKGWWSAYNATMAYFAACVWWTAAAMMMLMELCLEEPAMLIKSCSLHQFPFVTDPLFFLNSLLTAGP